MKRLNLWLVIASVAAAFCWTAGQASAQGRGGRGGFDPEQFRQRMMERFQEVLEVENDAEWKIIEGRITKIFEARREVGFGGMGRGFMGRRPPSGGGGREGDRPRGGDERDRRGGPRGEPDPDVDALRKALEAKAPASEIKAKLEKVRAARKQKQAALEKAQEDLRKVLTVRQEALAAMAGLIPLTDGRAQAATRTC